MGLELGLLIDCIECSDWEFIFNGGGKRAALDAVGDVMYIFGLSSKRSDGKGWTAVPM